METLAPGTPSTAAIPVAFIDWDSAGSVDPLADAAAHLMGAKVVAARR
jgi:hypothetical protein